MAVEATAPDRALEPVLEFAALSGSFDPSLALSAAGIGEHSRLAVLASRLAKACDTHPGVSEAVWVMLTPERRKVLRRLKAAGRIGEAVEKRRHDSVDDGTDRLLQAIEGRGVYDLEAAEALALQPKPPRAQLEEMIVALDRAGDIAPAYAALPLLRCALARLDQQQRLEDLNRRGLVLRKAHQDQVKAWLEKPFTKSPVKVLYAAGSPGIGKSVLLETSVQLASADVPPILVRLDFDRVGLDVLDELGLTAEVARQVANEAGAHGRALLEERLRSVSLAAGTTETLSAQRRVFPRQLAEAIGRTVDQSGRDVLVLLDTLEALRARGDTHPGTLFRWLDRLVDAGLRPVRVLAAGRDDTLLTGSQDPDRVGDKIDVDAMDDLSAAALMDRLEVPASLRPHIARIAAGNPLLMRVAAAVTQERGATDLRHQAGEIAEAYLYRILLSRIDDDRLRRLLAPGLILGTISAEVLRKVVAPALGLPPVTESQAEALFKALENQTWLIEPDPYSPPGFVRMRWPLRTVILPLLYGSMKAECARLDRSAAHWFSQQDHPWLLTLATYHRLQRMRVGRAPVGISPQMALEIDDKMIGDLPPRAQDLVRSLRGDRTSQLRSGSGGGLSPDDLTVARELMGIIERQDWNEGRHAAEQLTGGGAVDPRSLVADSLRAFWWRSGRWGRAREWMVEQEQVSRKWTSADLEALPPLLALVRLEMEAEFEPARLARRIRNDPAIAEIAIDLAKSSADDLARRGALALVVAAAMGGVFLGAEDRGGDVAGAAFAFFGQRTRPGSEDDLRRVLGDAQERMMARGAGGTPSEFEPSSVARLVAVLTPYSAMAVNLSIQSEYGWLAQWAEASDAKLAAAGALLPWEGEVQARSREHPLLALARLGLFAEWAQAAALFSRSPDLRLIGRSAEAWRRTVAGDWRYGRRPRGWRRCVTDVTLEQRLHRLLESEDPGMAAIEQLGLWSPAGEPDGEKVWALIAGRTRPGRGGDPAGEMRRLLGNRMPSSLAPGAVVLGMMRG